MKKKKSFRSTILNRYGRTRANRGQGPPVTLVARQFDTGRDFSTIDGQCPRREYDIAVKGQCRGAAQTNMTGSLSGQEYDIGWRGIEIREETVSEPDREQKETAVESAASYSHSLESTGRRQDFVLEQRRQRVRRSHSFLSKSDKDRSNRVEAAQGNGAASKTRSAGTAGRTGKSVGTVESPVSENDLLEDMKSILSGSKRYDPRTGKVVSRKNQPDRPDQTVARQLPDTSAAPAKTDSGPGEHEIFDRIAQSMKYANAYDLGSISMEKRFDEFDQLDELRNRSKAAGKTAIRQSSPPSPPSASVSPEPDLLSASTQDFLEDLDFISSEKSRSSRNGQQAETDRIDPEAPPNQEEQEPSR